MKKLKAKDIKSGSMFFNQIWVIFVVDTDNILMFGNSKSQWLEFKIESSPYVVQNVLTNFNNNNVRGFEWSFLR